jgi:hypothetical protein
MLHVVRVGIDFVRLSVSPGPIDDLFYDATSPSYRDGAPDMLTRGLNASSQSTSGIEVTHLIQFQAELQLQRSFVLASISLFPTQAFTCLYGPAFRISTSTSLLRLLHS